MTFAAFDALFRGASSGGRGRPAADGLGTAAAVGEAAAVRRAFDRAAAATADSGTGWEPPPKGHVSFFGFVEALLTLAAGGGGGAGGGAEAGLAARVAEILAEIE